METMEQAIRRRSDVTGAHGPARRIGSAVAGPRVIALALAPFAVVTALAKWAPSEPVAQ
ncbi:hypothetical protein QDR37_03595 [Amnibacterium sp. CER49]|uniref:hypothetical protein n=1 Tax=Amnibacterium sp. CER49 TaxID=3039161 RepID=UPI0024473834|nr:hypothetical protein [Amnibacterium sp. CER49]MDH2443024.1 hypothetical protein [Amnibacterium sp. CER49]